MLNETIFSTDNDENISFFSNKYFSNIEITCYIRQLIYICTHTCTHT